MLYFSEKSKKFYKTEKELVEAEKAYDAEQAEATKKANERKTRAKAVEKAYKHAEEVRKEAAEQIRKADKEYYDLKNKFVKDYGAFHWSIDDCDSDSDEALDAFSNILRVWFW